VTCFMSFILLFKSCNTWWCFDCLQAAHALLVCAVHQASMLWVHAVVCLRYVIVSNTFNKLHDASLQM
jgi:hypothetical protein